MTRRGGGLVAAAAALSVAATLAQLPRPACAANGAAPVSVGPKGPVSIPIGGDAQTVYRMPSSVGWVEGNRIDLDLFLYQSYGVVRNKLNNYALDASTPAGSGGIVVSLRRLLGLDREDDPKDDLPGIVLGLGEYVALAGGGTPANLYSTTFPEGKKTTVGITFLTTALSVAVRPVEWLSIGGGVHFIYGSVAVQTLIEGNSTSLDGSPKIQGVPLPGNPTYADFLKIFASDQSTDPTTFVESDLKGLQLGGILSLSFRPHERIGFGIAYSPKPIALVDFQGSAKIDATRTFESALSGLSPAVRQLFLGTLPNQGGQGFIGQYDMKLKGLTVPQTVRMNVAVWPHDRLLLAAEVAWYEWSKAIVAKTELSNGSNADLNQVIGSSTVATKLQFNWSNQWVFSGQAAFLLVEDLLVVRAGINYGRSPVDPNLLGNSPNSGLVSWNGMLGAGVYLGPVELSVTLEHGFHGSGRAPRSPSLTTKDGYYSARQFFLHVGAGISF